MSIWKSCGLFFAIFLSWSAMVNASQKDWIETSDTSVFLRINSTSLLRNLDDDTQRCQLADYSRYHGKILEVQQNWLKVKLQNPPPSCIFGSLEDNKAGWIYRPHLKSFSQEASSRNIAKHYYNNYNRIRAKARQFWPNSFACAAFASTALQDYGLPVEQVLVTNEVESQLKRLGFIAIRDMSQLRVGDIVFASKQGSNLPGTYAHVFVFNGYTSNRRSAYAIDNYNRSYVRNLYAGGYTHSVIAYRKP